MFTKQLFAKQRLIRGVLWLALLCASWGPAIQPAAAGSGLPPVAQAGEQPPLPPELEQLVQDTLAQDLLGVPVPKLTASAGPGDGFGFSAALSSDGNTAIIGAKTADVGAASGQGAAYIFVRSGNTWSQQARLVAEDGQAGDEFGHAVALSDDGMTALVGAYKADHGSSADAGAAYVYIRSSGTGGWPQQARLTVTASQAEAYLGCAVALSADGNTALLGAYKYDVGADADEGGAFIFNRSGAAWTQGPLLGAGTAANYNGYSVALNNAGDLALLGAPGFASGGKAQSGRVSFFKRSAGIWTLKNHYAPADLLADDWFGRSVALDDAGYSAIVGASRADVNGMAQHGAAYVLLPTAASWINSKLVGSGDAEDFFGVSVAISGDGKTVLVGAYRADPAGLAEQGAAFSYTITGGIWSSQEQFALSKAAGDNFGIAVALNAAGSTYLMGAYRADLPGSANQGAAYVAVLSGGNSIPQATLSGSEGAQAEFGYAVALSDDGTTAVVGAPGASDAGMTGIGAAYVFVYTATGWTQQARLAASDGSAEAKFGHSVAISGDGNTLIVGAPGAAGTIDPHQGAAYVFTRSGAQWAQLSKLYSNASAGKNVFGSPVAVSDDGRQFLIGALGIRPYQFSPDFDKGQVHLFTRVGSGWSMPQTITGDQHTFGCALALSGDGLTALISQCQYTILTVRIHGKVTVYRLDGGVIQSQATLLPGVDAFFADFGRSLGVDDRGQVAVVGEPATEPGGRVYFYTRRGADWTESARLPAPDAELNERFGAQISLSGNGVVLLSRGQYASESKLPVVYPYLRNGVSFVPQTALMNSGFLNADLYSPSIAQSDSGAAALIGAAGASAGGVSQGVAYIYPGSYRWSTYLPLILK